MKKEEIFLKTCKSEIAHWIELMLREFPQNFLDAKTNRPLVETFIDSSENFEKKEPTVFFDREKDSEEIVLFFMNTHMEEKDPKTGESVGIKILADRVKTLPRYYSVVAKNIVKNLSKFSSNDDLSMSDIENRVTLEEEFLQELFLSYIEMVRQIYHKNETFEVLKKNTLGEIDKFGMWVFIAEEEKRPHEFFDTETLMNKDGLNLSYKECIQYFYFIASKVIE